MSGHGDSISEALVPRFLETLSAEAPCGCLMETESVVVPQFFSCMEKLLILVQCKLIFCSI